jgi:hypothetical protein
VLVLRVWVERERPVELRARITSRLDLSSGRQRVEVAASAPDIVERVRQWLEEFTSAVTPP